MGWLGECSAGGLAVTLSISRSAECCSNELCGVCWCLVLRAEAYNKCHFNHSNPHCNFKNRIRIIIVFASLFVNLLSMRNAAIMMRVFESEC